MGDNCSDSSPISLLECLLPENCLRIAVVLLNTPLDGRRERFYSLWQKAVYRVCVDGGINELHKRFSDVSDMKIPHAITGDFDSASPEIIELYKAKGVSIVHTPDQDHTDFSKCLMHLVEELKSKHIQVDQIIAYCSPHHMDRFDQMMANINTLYLAKKVTDIPLILMSEHATMHMLSPGYSKLQVDTGLEGQYCGLIPVGAPCECVTTTGLKWNLDKQKLEFGQLISTSNEVIPGSKFVTVETSNPLLWTISIVII